jgi:BCD family chlorophyll transporter-like MFS transporter
MSLLRILRLGLLHVAVAITLVPITGVLNRIMIHEMALPASIVASLVVLPSLLSPLQVLVGQYSDRNPLFGYRRTPYIAAGALLCVCGAVATPYVALLMAENFWPGLLMGIVVFGIWGLGFNIAVVSYLSLASDLSTEQDRSRTIAVMWFMMISSVIITAIFSGRALDPYSDAQLIRVFAIVGGASFSLLLLGLIGLEPRYQAAADEERHSHGDALRAVLSNPGARLFFVYLVLLLAAILGQDVLLEPYGAQLFDMNVRETTQLTAVWGGMTLLALLVYGFVLNRWMSKKTGAYLGNIVAAAGLLTIALSGILQAEPLFVPGVALLGFGTGIATSTNLALMLDMTTPEQVGLFIGAWGVADAMARGTGNLLGGVARDVLTYSLGNAGSGYIIVFLLEALMLGVAIMMLRHIDVGRFRAEQPALSQILAATGDA